MKAFSGIKTCGYQALDVSVDSQENEIRVDLPFHTRIRVKPGTGDNRMQIRTMWRNFAFFPIAIGVALLAFFSAFLVLVIIPSKTFALIVGTSLLLVHGQVMRHARAVWEFQRIVARVIRDSEIPT